MRTTLGQINSRDGSDVVVWRISCQRFGDPRLTANTYTDASLLQLGSAVKNWFVQPHKF